MLAEPFFMKALAMTKPHHDVDNKWQICPPHYEHPDETTSHPYKVDSV